MQITTISGKRSSEPADAAMSTAARANGNEVDEDSWTGDDDCDEEEEATDVSATAADFSSEST